MHSISQDDLGLEALQRGQWLHEPRKRNASDDGMRVGTLLALQEQITKEGAMNNTRERLERERDAAIGRLRELGISPHLDEADAPHAGKDTVRDEGDVAQASERQDLSFMTRERVAERVNQLSAALRRLHEGQYGTCERCGRAIEPARLAALPEATRCRACQEVLERERGQAA